MESFFKYKDKNYIKSYGSGISDGRDMHMDVAVCR